MTSGISQVDLAGLGTVVNGQDQAVESGRTEFHRMLSESSALAAGWQGQASQRFQQALQSLGANGDQLFNALNGMSALMSQTKTGFGTTNDETTNASNTLAGNVGNVSVAGLPGL